nr:globin domain-containing protein [Spelaeibacter cavernicola]
MDSARLQSSWRDVEKVGDDAVQYFYSHLFLTHPEVREMFPISMTAQRDRFFTALGAIVADVDRIGTDTAFLRQLGHDHRRFDVIAAHYPAAGASLLATLQYFLGAAWTDDLAEDWADAYGVIAKIMVVAAEDADECTPPWWEAQVLFTERRTLDVGVLEIRPGEPYPFRARAIDGAPDTAAVAAVALLLAGQRAPPRRVDAAERADPSRWAGQPRAGAHRRRRRHRPHRGPHR